MAKVEISKKLVVEEYLMQPEQAADLVLETCRGCHMCPETVLNDKIDPTKFIVEGLIAGIDRPVSGGRRLVCPLVRDFEATVLGAPTDTDIIKADSIIQREVTHLKKTYKTKRIAFKPRRSGEK